MTNPDHSSVLGAAKPTLSCARGTAVSRNNPLTFLDLKVKCNGLVFEEILKSPFICLLLASPGSTSLGLWSLL